MQSETSLKNANIDNIRIRHRSRSHEWGTRNPESSQQENLRKDEDPIRKGFCLRISDNCVADVELLNVFAAKTFPCGKCVVTIRMPAPKSSSTIPRSLLATRVRIDIHADIK